MHVFTGQETELTMHDGTVRDLCFVEDSGSKSSLLISGGAGDCKIYVTDTATGTPFQALSGHTGEAHASRRSPDTRVRHMLPGALRAHG
jgi:WD40 repeat protein